MLPGRATTGASTGCASRAGGARLRAVATTRRNRGFLRALDGLARTAAAIGEVDEAQRCDEFLRQLEPAWDEIPPEEA